MTEESFTFNSIKGVFILSPAKVVKNLDQVASSELILASLLSFSIRIK